MEDYHFYTITCKDKDIKSVYVGSTYNWDHRVDTHTSDSKKKNTKLYKSIREHGGIENWEMEEIGFQPELFPPEAHVIEELYRELYSADLNTYRCYLTKEQTKLYRKEYQATYNPMYRETNKDYFKEYSKNYYQNNKESQQVSRQEYRDSHKLERAEYDKRRRKEDPKYLALIKSTRPCPICNKQIQYGNLNRHKKTQHDHA